jgi:hypothetical protein
LHPRQIVHHVGNPHGGVASAEHCKGQRDQLPPAFRSNGLFGGEAAHAYLTVLAFVGIEKVELLHQEAFGEGPGVAQNRRIIGQGQAQSVNGLWGPVQGYSKGDRLSNLALLGIDLYLLGKAWGYPSQDQHEQGDKDDRAGELRALHDAFLLLRASGLPVCCVEDGEAEPIARAAGLPVQAGRLS